MPLSPPCPTESELSAFLDGRGGDSAPAIDRHLGRCAACRRRADRLVADPTVVPADNPPANATEVLPAGFLDRLTSCPPAELIAPAGKTYAEHLPAIPGYAVRRVIGRGGMGVVYEAAQLSLGRAVAVKTLAGGLFAAAGDRERFRREAEAIARLQHPNVVQVIEVGEADGLPYLVMEYVRGRTLADQLTGSPWPPRKAADLVRTLARAVQSAHAHGIVHRDLKPANVLLTEDGTPKVADFGLARVTDDPAAQTVASGRIFGTPAYSAPEQLAADLPASERTAGPAADVYSLGVILYELLAGRPPFAAARPMDTLIQVLHTDPIPPARLEPSIPKDVETICLKCLRKQPRRRYATADDLADDLGRFLDGRPVAARPVAPAERAWRWLLRHPAYTSALGAAAAVVLISGVSLVWLWRAAVARSEAEGQARAESDRRATAEETARRVTDRRAVELEIDQGVSLCERGEVDRGAAVFAAVAADPDATPDLARLARRNLAAWAYRQTRPTHELPHDDTPHLVEFAPDGRRAATAAGKDVSLWNTETGNRVVGPVRFETPVRGVRVSPDGRTVLAFDAAEVRLVPAGPDGTAAAARFPRPVRAAAFAPDGRTVYVGVEDGTAAALDAADLRPGRRWGLSPGVSALAVRPDGRGLAVGTDAGAVAFLDPARDEPTATAALPAGVTSLAYTGDGRYVAAGAKNDAIEILDSTDGKPASRTLAPRMPLGGVVVPAKSDVVIGGFGEGPPRRRGECIVWSVPTGRRLRTQGFQGDVTAVAATPDGDRLLIGGGQRWAGLMVGMPWRPAQLRLGHAGFVRAVALAADGRTAVVSHFPGARQLNPTHSRTQVWELPPDQRTALRIDFPSLFTLDAARDAPLVAATDRAGAVRCWDAATGVPVGPAAKLPERVWVLAAHPRGESVLAVTNRTAHLIDPRTGRTRDFPLVNADPKAGRFAPDGETFAVSGPNRTARVYRTVAPGEPILTLPHPEVVVGLDFAPDGRRLVLVGIHGTVTSWTLDPPAIAYSVRVGREANAAVTFAPDGRRFAVGGGDRSVTVCDAATGVPVGPAFAAPDLVIRLEWSADGLVLVTCLDGTIRLWDAATGRPVGPSIPVAGSAGAFADGGKTVLTGDPDQGVVGWAVP